MTTKAKNGPRITRIATKRILLLLAGTLTVLGACALAQILDPAATLPVDSGAEEKTSNLYENPQPVSIDGYDDDCMEPFITGDGRYLLFNNSNSPIADTHIHICKRMGENSFKHLGHLSGSVSKSKDMAPTIDADGHLYFTTLRSFDEDGHSIYCGEFANEHLKNVAVANGDISPHKPAEINMDCDISKDGKTLVLSRAHFANPLLPPDKSDLRLAWKENGKWTVDADRQSVLSNLNTNALEYAPCLSADQLELYFTRASKRILRNDSKNSPPQSYLRIMVAKRKNLQLPFEKPARLSALSGFIEAPTITDDKIEMFFHKKVGDKFRIFRSKRRAEP